MVNGEAKKATKPPLFIKVEKYQEVIEHIEKLRSYALSLRDALDAISAVEKQLRQGLLVTTRVLDRFNLMVSTIDAKLTHKKIDDRIKKAVSEKEIKVESPKEIEDYVKGLYEQMERIKKDLQNVSA
jgi:ATP-dependent Lon protease